MWRLWSWKDAAGVLLVGLLVGGLVCVALWQSSWRGNFGFSAEWLCSNFGGYTEAVCLKKPPKP